MKKIVALILTAVVVLTFCSCGAKSGDEETPITLPGQLSGPQEGDMVAVIETTKGTIRIRLFPEYAVIACENFQKLAESGYYNGCTIHKIIEDFVIQTGDPTGTGHGGESAWGYAFANEYSDALHNYTGAVGVANNGDGTNGSQFYIVTGAPLAEEMLTALDVANYPEDVIEAYRQTGGQPLLDYRYTVFGQVYEGLDILNKIDSVKTDDLMRPKKKITVKSVIIETYTEEISE